MTILAGEVVKAEGVYDLIDQLDISPRELVDALDRERKNALCKRFNEHRDGYDPADHPEWNGGAVESIQDLPEFVFEEWDEWITADLQEPVFSILEDRDQEYVHTTDAAMGTTFHTVVRVSRLEQEE